MELMEMLISKTKIKTILGIFLLMNVSYADNQQLSMGECSPNIHKINGDTSIDCSKHQTTVYQVKNSSFSSAENKKLQAEKVKYLIKKDDKNYSMVTALFAEVNGQPYEIISLKDEQCFVIESQKDFDKNGGIDVLLSYNLCGGNGAGNSFSVILNYGDGHFQEKEIPEGSWGSAIVKKWEDRWSILIENSPDGVGHTDLEKTEFTYVVDNNGNIKEIVNAKKFKLFAEVEVYSSELNHDLDYNKFDFDNKKIVYDLNDDGKNEYIRFKYWERWGAMMSYIVLPDGSEQDLHAGCKRVGILKSKTQGMHDIVCNHSDLFKWNGKQYIDMDK